MKTKQSYGIQPWSAGEWAPYVIAADVRFDQWGIEESRAYTIIAPTGEEIKGYAEYEQAEAAARHFAANPGTFGQE